MKNAKGRIKALAAIVLLVLAAHMSFTYLNSRYAPDDQRFAVPTFMRSMCAIEGGISYEDLSCELPK